MGSERKDGAGKSLDALVRAFRESRFAVFFIDEFNPGFFSPEEYVPLTIALRERTRGSNKVPGFFNYANNYLFQSCILRVRFEENNRTDMMKNGMKYWYSLRGNNISDWTEYRDATEDVIRKLPHMIKDYSQRTKHMCVV